MLPVSHHSIQRQAQPCFQHTFHKRTDKISGRAISHTGSPSYLCVPLCICEIASKVCAVHLNDAAVKSVGFPVPRSSRFNRKAASSSLLLVCPGSLISEPSMRKKAAHFKCFYINKRRRDLVQLVS